MINKGFGLTEQNGNVNIDSDTIFRLASVTKQFTAMAIMILQQQGLLDINETISNYIPDYPESTGKKITIKHLLRHTSGIPNYTLLPTFVDFTTQYHTPEELVSFFKDLPLDFPPGTKFNYSNSGYAVLGHLIEVISGSTYQTFIDNEIFIPLQMTRSGYGENDFNAENTAHGYTASGQKALAIDMSVPYSAGALTSTANDLFLWDQSFYNNSLLTEENTRILYTPGVNNYAMGWNITKAGDSEIYSHAGLINGFSSYIIREPSKQRLIVILSNREGYNTGWVADKLHEMLNLL
jgi:CubicO group peptidase (beta-lactamase class C family)